MAQGLDYDAFCEMVKRRRERETGAGRGRLEREREREGKAGGPEPAPRARVRSGEPSTRNRPSPQKKQNTPVVTTHSKPHRRWKPAQTAIWAAIDVNAGVAAGTRRYRGEREYTGRESCGMGVSQ